MADEPRAEGLRDAARRSLIDVYGERAIMDIEGALATPPQPAALDVEALERDAATADHDSIDGGPDFARGIRYVLARLTAKEQG